jgi:hypothetical protein
VQYAHWAVFWSKPDGRIGRFVPDPKTDLVEAQRIYDKLRDAGRKNVTLVTLNTGYPPPDKYADHEKVLIGRRKRDGVKVYRPQRVEPRQYQVRMKSLNRRGVWWCPRCRKLRRFVRKKGFRLDGIWVPDEHHACPMCTITHRDGHVRRYNPITQVIPTHTRKGRKRRRYRSDVEEDD